MKQQKSRLWSLHKPCPSTSLLLLYVWIKLVTTKARAKGQSLSPYWTPAIIHPGFHTRQANFLAPGASQHVGNIDGWAPQSDAEIIARGAEPDKTTRNWSKIHWDREIPQLLAGRGKELYLFWLPKSKQGKIDPRLPSRAVNSHTTFKKLCVKEMKSSESYYTLLKSFKFSFENTSTIYLPKSGVLWSLFTK